MCFNNLHNISQYTPLANYQFDCKVLHSPNQHNGYELSYFYVCTCWYNDMHIIAIRDYHFIHISSPKIPVITLPMHSLTFLSVGEVSGVQEEQTVHVIIFTQSKHLFRLPLLPDGVKQLYASHVLLLVESIFKNSNGF